MMEALMKALPGIGFSFYPCMYNVYAVYVYLPCNNTCSILRTQSQVIKGYPKSWMTYFLYGPTDAFIATNL